MKAEFVHHSGGNKNLSNIIGRLFHKHKGQYVNEGFANAIGHETTIGAIGRRAELKGLTGEWIVFAKHKGKRFYLCLSAHTESNEQILARAKDAISMDYEFLDSPCRIR